MSLVNKELLTLPIRDTHYSVSRVTNGFGQHTCINCYHYLFFAYLKYILGVVVLCSSTHCMGNCVFLLPANQTTEWL